MFRIGSRPRASIGSFARGDLDRVEAEAEARHAPAIWEPLGHPETWKVDANLADIAPTRGDADTAALTPLTGAACDNMAGL